MKLPVYWGCKIPTTQYAYELSVREILPRFDVELIDLNGSSCCGGPVRSINDHAALYLSARNLALSSQAGGENLLVPCNECHFMLSEAKHRIENDAAAHAQINRLLGEEGLEYPSQLRIWHVVDLLHDLIGTDTIKAMVIKPLEGMRFAAHPGCQIIRPSEIGRVDHPEKPKKLDNLIEALGAEALDYSEKLDCCGAALLYSHEDAALSLAGAKLKALQAYGIDGFVDTCPYCHTMYDAKQKEAASTVGGKISIPTFYFTQLLGVAMGVEAEKLGLHLNQSDVEKLEEKLK